MKNNLDRIAPFLPWLGLLLLLAGVVVYIITRQFDLATNLLLAGGAVALLLFAVLRPDRVRLLFSGRQARYGTTTLLSVLFFTAIVVLLYWITYRNNDWRWDATETDEFTPLPETVELLEGLQEPIHVIGFYTLAARGQQDTAQARLESLAAVTPMLTYKFQDPNANPIEAQKYELAGDATLVFTQGEGEAEVFSKAIAVSDRDIHSALLQVINPVEKKVYFITGHGERSTEDFGQTGLSNLVEDVGGLGFTVEPLTLAGGVPEDADAVVLIDQQTPMQPEEVAAIANYLQQGGSAFLARDVTILDQALARIEGDGLNNMLLDEWGIRLLPDVIIETNPQLALSGQQVPLIFIAVDYGTSPITSQELQTFGSLFVIARSVTTQESGAVTHTELVRTSEESWGETNPLASPLQPSPEDATGPMALGVSAENSASGSRLVVFGDADFLSNEAYFRGGNSLLFTNSLNWLVGDETTLSLTPRETVNRQVTIPQAQLGVLQIVSCLLGPALMALVGIVVWVSRRRSR